MSEEVVLVESLPECPLCGSRLTPFWRKGEFVGYRCPNCRELWSEDELEQEQEEEEE